MSERSEVIERAVAAYGKLGELAETIEDEWQYVNDLVEAYTASLGALTLGEALSAEAVDAVDEAIAEIGLIRDAHKAIDWLSTFPHAVALAVGGDVDRVDAAADEAADDTAEGAAERAAAADEPPHDDEPDDDNPFAALLRRNR